MRRRKRAKDFRALRMGQSGSKSEEVYQLLDEIPLTATAAQHSGERSNHLYGLNICFVQDLKRCFSDCKMAAHVILI